MISIFLCISIATMSSAFATPSLPDQTHLKLEQSVSERFSVSREPYPDVEPGLKTPVYSPYSARLYYHEPPHIQAIPGQRLPGKFFGFDRATGEPLTITNTELFIGGKLKVQAPSGYTFHWNHSNGTVRAIDGGSYFVAQRLSGAIKLVARTIERDQALENESSQSGNGLMYFDGKAWLKVFSNTFTSASIDSFLDEIQIVIPATTAPRRSDGGYLERSGSNFGESYVWTEREGLVHIGKFYHGSAFTSISGVGYNDGTQFWFNGRRLSDTATVYRSFVALPGSEGILAKDGKVYKIRFPGLRTWLNTHSSRSISEFGPAGWWSLSNTINGMYCLTHEGNVIDMDGHPITKGLKMKVIFPMNTGPIFYYSSLKRLQFYDHVGQELFMITTPGEVLHEYISEDSSFFAVHIVEPGRVYLHLLDLDRRTQHRIDLPPNQTVSDVKWDTQKRAKVRVSDLVDRSRSELWTITLK